MLIRWDVLAEQDTAPQARLKLPPHMSEESWNNEANRYMAHFQQNLRTLPLPTPDDASGAYLAFELSVLNDGTGASDPTPGDPAGMASLPTMADCIDGYAATGQEAGVAVFSVGQARLVGKTSCPPGSLDCEVVLGVAWHGG